MIDIQELRIGNLIYSKVNPKLKKYHAMRVTGLSTSGTLDTKNSKHSCNNVSINDIHPFPITTALIKGMIERGLLQVIPESKNIYYFPGKSQTYFLVYDKNDKKYYMGMVDVNLPKSNPRRVSKPFTEFHKLQNAYRVVYEEEMKIFAL